MTSADQPTIEQVRALNGRIFSMLTEEEKTVLTFFSERGRRFGVAISILNEADHDELARAPSRDHADEILTRANSRVSVLVSSSR
ncbi:hypothetical protein [Paraburkholderia sp. J8-2]|uniref:hypothetical protein n=1 Tax=Paraburkholderia sp. J8-2 TaxID=2805440 RepID=UPI002AB7BDC9|nr:hypothetical protein [Paraburkholderia sp. J8-2]